LELIAGDMQTGYQYPAPFKLAVQITFSMLSHVLKNPTRKVLAVPFTRVMLNPYLTIILIFIFMISKHPATLAILECSIPWSQPAVFFTTVSCNVMLAQSLNESGIRERWVILMSSCVLPLPEAQ
jgi:protein SMG6